MSTIYVNAAWTDEAAFNADSEKPEGLVWNSTAFATVAKAVGAAASGAEIKVIAAEDAVAEYNSLKLTKDVTLIVNDIKFSGSTDITSGGTLTAGVVTTGGTTNVKTNASVKADELYLTGTFNTASGATIEAGLLQTGIVANRQFSDDPSFKLVNYTTGTVKIDKSTVDVDKFVDISGIMMTGSTLNADSMTDLHEDTEGGILRIKTGGDSTYKNSKLTVGEWALGGSTVNLMEGTEVKVGTLTATKVNNSASSNIRLNNSSMTAENISYDAYSYREFSLKNGSSLTVNGTFENKGQVKVDASKFTAKSFENNGTFTISNGAEINTVISGKGDINISNAVLNVSTPLTAGTITIDSNGSLILNKSTVEADNVENNGTFKVTGAEASTVKATITGKALQLDGGVLTDSEILGDAGIQVFGKGNSIVGTNTINGKFYVGYPNADYNSATSLTVTGTLNATNSTVGAWGTLNIGTAIAKGASEQEISDNRTTVNINGAANWINGSTVNVNNADITLSNALSMTGQVTLTDSNLLVKWEGQINTGNGTGFVKLIRSTLEYRAGDNLAAYIGGYGYEGVYYPAVLQVTDHSTLKGNVVNLASDAVVSVENSAFDANRVTNKGTINVNGGTVDITTLTNNGTFTVEGENEITIGKFINDGGLVQVFDGTLEGLEIEGKNGAYIRTENADLKDITVSGQGIYAVNTDFYGGTYGNIYAGYGYVDGAWKRLADSETKIYNTVDASQAYVYNYGKMEITEGSELKVNYFAECSKNVLAVDGTITAGTFRGYFGNVSKTGKINANAAVQFYGNPEIKHEFTINGEVAVKHDVAKGTNLSIGFNQIQQPDGNGGYWYIGGSNTVVTVSGENAKLLVQKGTAGNANAVIHVDDKGYKASLNILNGAEFKVEGTLTNNGIFNVNGGTVDITTLTNNDTFTVNGGTFTAGTVTNNGSVTVNGGTFTADAFAQNSSEQAVFNNVVMDVGSLDTGSKDKEWVVIGGKSKVMIDKLSGSNAVRFAAGTTLLDGTSIEGLGVRSLGALTVGEKATDTIYTYHYDTTRASVGTITVNGEWKIGKDHFGIATWSTGDAIKLTGAGTVNVDSQVFFEGYWPGDADFYTVKGDILVDEKLTINMVNEGDVASHLRFSYTDVTIKGIVANKGTTQNMTALCEADVIVTGNKAKLDLEGYLTIGNVYDIYNNTVTDAHKSSLTVSNGASVNAQNVFVNLDSKINVNNATFSVSTIDNNGIITISGNSTVNATVAGKAVTLAKNAVLAGNLNANITVSGTASLAADTVFTGSIASGSLKVAAGNVLSITDSSDATLLVAAGDYSDDKFGSAVIKGATKNAKVTFSSSALNGNMISNVYLNVTDVDYTDGINITIDKLANIKSINGNELFGISGKYYFKDSETSTLYELVSGAKVTFINATVAGTEISSGNISDLGNSGVDVEAGEGKVDFKLGKNEEVEIGNITKNENGGTTNLSTSTNSSLTGGDVEALGKLTTGTGANVDLDNVKGTALNTTISLGKSGTAAFESIDLGAGKNTLSIGASTSASVGNANVAGDGDVTDVRTIKLASGKAADKTELNVSGDIVAPETVNSISLGNNAVLNVAGDLVNHDINVGTTVKAGKAASVSFNNMTYVAGISIGTGSFFSANEITGTAGKNTFALGADMTGNGANKEVVINSVDMKGGKNTFSVGARTDVVITDDLSNVSTLKLANGTYYKKTKKNPTAYTNETSLAIMQKFTGVNATVAIGNYASFSAADMTGVSKLTVGKNSKFTAAAITANEKNNTFSFNSNAVANVGSIDFGAGNDTLKLASGVKLIADTLTFGEGTKDKLAFSKNASLVLTGDISGLESITGNKSNTIYLMNDATINEDVKGLDKINVVDVFDISAMNQAPVYEDLSKFNTADIFELGAEKMSISGVEGGSINVYTWSGEDWELYSTVSKNATISDLTGSVKVEIAKADEDKIDYAISIA